MDAWAAHRRAKDRLDRHVDRDAAAVVAGGIEARVMLALIAEYRRDERDAYRRAQKGSGRQAGSILRGQPGPHSARQLPDG